MRPSSESARAALAALAILQIVMLASLFAETAPHPPRAIPLFAMGPFLALSLALVAAAWLLGDIRRPSGRLACAAAAAAALLSYGPQKWVDPAIGEIWPAVLGGQIAAAVLLLGAALGASASRAAAPG